MVVPGLYKRYVFVKIERVDKQFTCHMGHMGQLDPKNDYVTICYFQSFIFKLLTRQVVPNLLTYATC